MKYMTFNKLCQKIKKFFTLEPKSKLIWVMRIALITTIITSLWSYISAIKEIKNTIEQKLSIKADMLTIYLSMLSQNVDSMASSISSNYGAKKSPYLSKVRLYSKEKVWGLSGYDSDGGVADITGTCTGTGDFPLSKGILEELNAVLSIDPQIKSLMEHNKNIIWVYYTSKNKFLYLAPKLTISQYQFSVDEYKKPFWYQAIPQNNKTLKQIISDLYYDSVTGLPMITISSPVIIEKEFKGVISLDLLTSFLEELTEIENIPGETILIDEKGQFVAGSTKRSQEKKYNINTIIGPWHYGEEGALWIGYEIFPGELILGHKITKADILIPGLKERLPMWILIVFFLLFYGGTLKYISLKQEGKILLNEIETEKNLSMEILREKERFLETLISNLPGFIYRCAYDRDWTMFFISDGCKAITGYDPEDLINNKTLAFNDLIDPEYREPIWQEWIAIIKNKRHFEYEYPIITKSGEKRWVWERGVPIFSTSGEIEALEGFITDITKRKEAEKILEIFKASVENSTDAIGMSTPQGKHFYQNKAFTELFGDVGQYPPDTLYVDQKIGEEVFKTIISGNSWNGEVLMYSKNKDILNISLRAYAVKDETGKILALVGIHSDITDKVKNNEERQKLQEELFHSQKMELVGRLAGGVAHDFNNMLTVIIGQAELALLKISQESNVYKNIVEIEKAAKRSANITGQLLSFARKQSVQPRVINLNNSIESIISIIKRMIGELITLQLKRNDNAGNIFIDPLQIDQILTNLCINAKDAMNGKGKITISTDSVIIDENTKGNFYTEIIPGKWSILSVRDTGKGMSEEVLAHLFEPFFTTKALGKGTGLGLATVYGIVRQNKGLIEVVNYPGEGVEFKIYFPEVETPSETEKKVEEALDTETSGKSILLVEDEPMMLEMTEAMLHELGYKVTALSSPLKAIETAETNHFDLLLTDIIMPELNGLELVKNILQKTPELKILYMSGYTFDIISSEGIEEKNINFLQKPFNIAELSQKIKEALFSQKVN